MNFKEISYFVSKNFNKTNVNKILDFLYSSFFSEKIYKKYIAFKQNFPNNITDEQEIKHVYALALLLANSRKAYEAHFLFKLLLRIFPKASSEIYYNLGKNLNLIFKTKLAIFYLEQSLKANNKNFFVNYELGLANQRIGNIDLSKKYFKITFEIEPRFVEAHRLYSLSHKYTNKNDDHLKLMLEILKNINLKDSQKSQLFFAIGKAYDDLNVPSEAFVYYEKGNNLRRKELNYSGKINKLQFECIKKITSKPEFRNAKQIKEINEKIIFIVGMPRSGTTLLEQIISSHSKILSLGEPLHFPSAIKKFFPEKDLNLFEESFDKVSKKTIQNFRDYLKEKYNLDNKNILAVTDKLPFNFKFIGMINFFIPEAKIIHIKRSPQDTCLSILKNYFQGNMLGFAFNQDELAGYYQTYLDFMQHWRDLNSDFFEIEYENLVSDLETQSRNIFDYLQIPYEQDVLKFYENSNTVSSLSLTQVRQKNYTTSIQSWKKYKNYLTDSIINLK